MENETGQKVSGSIARDNNRSEQTGFEQIPVFSDCNIRLCITFLLRHVTISNQPVAPGINHDDFQLVWTGIQDFCNLHAKRLCPDNTQVLAVECNRRNSYVLDVI
jgi:hypothetical protein